MLRTQKLLTRYAFIALILLVSIATASAAAQFTITQWDYDNPVVVGDSITADITVENTGNETGSETFRYYFADTATSQDYEITSLAAGDEESFQYTVTVTEPTGTFDHSIRNDNGSTTYRSEQITVLADQAIFEITSWEYPEEVIVGETVESNITIENTGGVDGTADLEYFFDGNLTSQDAQVPVDAQDSFTFSFETEVTEPTGTFDHSIRLTNGTTLADGTVTVLQPAAFSVDWEVESDVIVGESTTSNTTITNTGDVTGTIYITYYFDGEENVPADVEVTLGAGQSTTIPQTAIVDDLDGVGTFNHSLRDSEGTILAQEEITIKYVQDLIDEAAAGDTITLPAGTYAEALTINKELTLQGAGEDETIIDAGDSSASYGIAVTGNNVVLRDFTLRGDTSQSQPRYGLHTSGPENLTVASVTIEEFYRTGFDLNSVNTADISDITSQNNGGAGIFLPHSFDVTLTDITTLGNSWGAVGISTDGTGYVNPAEIQGIVFAGSFDVSEDIQLYIEEAEEGNLEITFSDDISDAADVTLPSSMSYYVQGEIRDENAYTQFFASLSDAEEAFDTLSASYDPVLRDVENGLAHATEQLDLQTALAGLTEGETLVVSGTHTGNLDVSKSLSFTSDSATLQDANIRITASNVSFDGFTFENGNTRSASENAAILLVAGSDDVTVRNSAFTRTGGYSSYRAIINEIGGVGGLTITNNTFTGWATGVYLQNAEATVNKNSFTSNNVGLSTDYSTNVTITENTFSDQDFEGMGIGPSTTSITVSTNSFSSQDKHLGVYDESINTSEILASNDFQGAAILDGSIYGSIQQAIDAASQGSIVSVAQGTYNESLTILTSHIALVSLDGAQNTIIDAQEATNAIALGPYDKTGPHPTNITVQGFTVTGWAERGIAQRNGDGTVYIKDNVLEGPSSGARNAISIAGGVGSQVTGNTITTSSFEQEDWSGTGILAIGSVDALIQNNIVSGSDICINIAGYPDWESIDSEWVSSSGVVVDSNNVSDCETGIRVEGDSSETTVTGNLIENTETGLRENTQLGGEPSETTVQSNTFENNTAQIRSFDGGIDVINASSENSFDAAVMTETSVFSTIQAAIDEASADDTIRVTSGTYTESLDITKSLSIVGASRHAVIIDTSAVSGRSIESSGVDDITLANLTVIGSPDQYSIKLYDADNITLTDITVQDSYRSGIDLNAITNATLTDINSTNATRGVGLALSNVDTVTLTEVTTSENAWGGIGIYDYSTGASKNIFLNGSQQGETVGVYEDAEYGFAAKNLTLNGYTHRVSVAGSTRFRFYFASLDEAKSYADEYETQNNVSTLIKNIRTGEFVIEDDTPVGNILVEENASEDKDNVTTEENVTIEAEDVEVVLEEQTIITSSRGKVNASKITVKKEVITAAENVAGDAPTRGVMQWGIEGETLSFSKPVTLRVNVGTEYDGETLDVYRSTGLTSGWTQDGLVDKTCLVTNGVCSFRTRQASYFAASQQSTTTSSSGSSGSSGGANSFYYDRGQEQDTQESETSETPAQPQSDDQQQPAVDQQNTQQQSADTQDSSEPEGNALTGAVTGDPDPTSPLWAVGAIGAAVFVLGAVLIARRRR